MCCVSVHLVWSVYLRNLYFLCLVPRSRCAGQKGIALYVVAYNFLAHLLQYPYRNINPAWIIVMQWFLIQNICISDYDNVFYHLSLDGVPSGPI